MPFTIKIVRVKVISFTRKLLDLLVFLTGREIYGRILKNNTNP